MTVDIRVVGALHVRSWTLIRLDVGRHESRFAGQGDWWWFHILIILMRWEVAILVIISIESG